MACSVVITKNAARGLNKAPEYIVDKLRFWIDGVENKGLSSMQSVRGYRDHKLKGDRSHFSEYALEGDLRNRSKRGTNHYFDRRGDASSLLKVEYEQKSKITEIYR